MASSINASTSGAGGLITTADNTGILNLQTAGTTAISVDASQNVTINKNTLGYGTLNIGNSTATYNAITMQTGNNYYNDITYLDGSGTLRGYISLYANTTNPILRFGTNSSDKMQIDGSGNFTATIPSGSTLYPSFFSRAWVTFNGTGTVAIVGSGNVSSITDNAVGDYTVNFTTAMPDTNYAVVTGMSGNANTTNGNEFYVSSQIVGPAYNSGYTTTGSIRMLSMDGTGNNRDCADLNLAVFR